MDWIKLIIGLIVVIAWIAGNIREQQKAKAPPTPPPPPPRPPIDERTAEPARSIDDLNDFLREIRSKMQDTGDARPAEPMQAVLVEEPPAPPPPPVQRSKRNKQKSRSIDSPAPMLASPPLFASPAPRAFPPVTPVASVVTRQPTSPALRDLAKLLRSPSGLATAVVLREILDEPLCKRRRRSK